MNRSLELAGFLERFFSCGGNDDLIATIVEQGDNELPNLPLVISEQDCFSELLREPFRKSPGILGGTTYTPTFWRKAICDGALNGPKLKPLGCLV